MRFLVLGLLAVGLAAAFGSCRWSEVPANAVYACDDGQCPEGYLCRDRYCFLAPDCSGAGCACPPAAKADACADAGAACGEQLLPDGCGAVRVYDCGGCGDDSTCFRGQCCAAPPAAAICADAGHACGPFEARVCGKLEVVGCGGCPTGQSCAIGDHASACEPCVPESAADFCNRNGATCGRLSASDDCGLPRTESCGACDDGGCGSDAGPNLCACQPVLQGCLRSSQCCSGTCGAGGLCCVAAGGECLDDSDCCAKSCAQGRCEVGAGVNDGRP